MIESHTVVRFPDIAKSLRSQLALATLCALAMTCLFLSSNISKTGSLVLVVAVWAFFLAVLTMYLCSDWERKTVYGQICPRIIILSIVVSVGIALFVAGGTLLGTPQAYVADAGLSNLVKEGVFRSAFYACAAYSCGLLFLFKSKTPPREIAKRAWRHMRAIFSSQLALGIFALVCAAAIFATASRFLGGLSWRVSFCFGVAILVSMVYVANCIAKKEVSPSGLYLAFALPWALFLAICSPTITGISFDDHVHYAHSQALSYLINFPKTSAESSLHDVFFKDAYIGKPDIYGESWSFLSESVLGGYEERLNAAYPSSAINTLDPGVGSCLGLYNYIGYVPSATGLWLGRLMHLPLTVVFVMGRCFNALFYVFVSYAVIRIIPCKKMLLCVIAALPSTIFLSANYSYDPWLICMLYLMVSLVVKSMLSDDRSVGFERWLALLALGFVALAPKAVYFPLLALLFLIPKRKFESSEQCACFRYCIVLLAIVIASSFVAPFLISGGEGYSDDRGNDGIDASGQLGFILSQPLGYLSVLFNFIFNGYLSVPSFDALSYSFAYMNDVTSAYGWLSGLSLVVVVIAACADADSLSNRLSRFSYGATTIATCLLTVVLISTSLYIAFTPVHSNSIDGVQARYLTPLLFPFFLFALNLKLVGTSSPWRRNLVMMVLIWIPLLLTCASSLWLFVVA